MNVLRWVKKLFKSFFPDRRIESEYGQEGNEDSYIRGCYRNEKSSTRRQSCKRSTAQSAQKSADANDQANSTSKAATSEQHIERIKKCKDHYEVLQVSKKYDQTTLKKRYRELALKLHPDKCQADGASEAFKSVGNAYSTLSDSKKRQIYDAELKCGRQAVRPTRNQNFHGHRMNQRFDDFMTANEIFNAFFGGGFQSGSLFHHQNVFVQPGLNVRVTTWTFRW
ncbi:DnaJ-like protein subfamily B member 12 [Aphelenchoides bicaudatus]|nr:DnaJ-like protein subfamily B member 12 [Aphelenchoides bicaudatus]